MNGIAGFQQPLMQALGLAVLHSIWQGILLFCLLKPALAMVSERRAVLRYRLTYGAMLLLFGLFLYDFVSEWRLSSALQELSMQIYHTPEPPATVTAVSWQDSLLISYVTLFRRYTPVLALLYAAGLLLLSFRLIRELLQVRYLRRQVMLPESLLQERFIELKEQTGIRREVSLGLSQQVQVPLMLGHLKPIVLLPLSLMTRLDTQQLDAILLHELAHIRRHDYLWNILQMVMETLLFFNPVTWWLSAVIREEREHCCDDYVLKSTQKSLPYARALLALEEYRLARYTAVMQAGGNNKNTLLNRIKRMTTMKQHKGKSQRILATVTVVVLLAAMACFATAFGQNQTEKNRKKSVTKVYSKGKITVVDEDGKVNTYHAGDSTDLAEGFNAIPGAMALAENAVNAVDWDMVDKSVSQAMDKVAAIDWDDIQRKTEESVNQATRSIDWAEIQQNVDKAMQQVDWDVIQKSVDMAMKKAGASVKDADRKEMQAAFAEARAEVAKAMKEAKAEMSEAKRNEVREALKEAGIETRKALMEAREETGKAMKEAREETAKAMKEAREESQKALQEAREESRNATTEPE
ncbi:M56 family metallopeptidase [Taibaiella koreensis]|uniref:M56 family metallopeptidase n=1 Tax=Taibaiella koreensis TaxID=1268548 RepID=UPI000E5A084E|nr:M56 family metallopeptidase [Taibaiella koreensis]